MNNRQMNQLQSQLIYVCTPDEVSAISQLPSPLPQLPPLRSPLLRPSSITLCLSPTQSGCLGVSFAVAAHRIRVISCTRYRCKISLNRNLKPLGNAHTAHTTHTHMATTLTWQVVKSERAKSLVQKLRPRCICCCCKTVCT